MQVVALVGMIVCEASMRQSYRKHTRHMWTCRSMVLFNLACAAWQMARYDGAPWLLVFTPVSVYCAWYSFRTGEKFAGDLKRMRQSLASVREQIKNIQRMANES